MTNYAKYLPKTNKKCECGGSLRKDFPGAYMCDSCKYYESKGRVITRCDGSSAAEFVVEDYILYNREPYILRRREAYVGDLVLLSDETLEKRIHRISKYNGHHKRTIKLSNGDVLDYPDYVGVLVPLREVYQ